MAESTVQSWVTNTHTLPMYLFNYCATAPPPAKGSLQRTVVYSCSSKQFQSKMSRKSVHPTVQEQLQTNKDNVIPSTKKKALWWLEQALRK